MSRDPSNAITVKELLGRHTFWTVEVEIRRAEVTARLGDFLPENPAPLWYNVFHRFIEERPCRYWSPESLRIALGLLERDIPGAIDALNAWRDELGAAFDYSLLPSPVADDESSSAGMSVREVRRLATLFHPEYLRYCEHIFKNLIVAYWAILRRKVGRTRFNLRSAADHVKSLAGPSLVAGYDERVRNAIAHGQVVYRGLDIAYGPAVAAHTLSPLDLLHLFDELVRTTNALTLGVLLFLCRRGQEAVGKVRLPPTVVSLMAAGAIDAPAGAVLGCYESETALAGKQLHVGLRTPYVARETVSYLVAVLSSRLIESGAADYDRFLFEIDQGREPLSLAILFPRVLRALISESAPMSRLGEAFADTQLLWHHEGRWRGRIRAWRLILASQARVARFRLRKARQAAGHPVDHQAYVLRGFKNISVGGLARAEVVAVLRNPKDGNSRDRLRQIAYAVVQDARRRRVRLQFGNLGRRWGWRVRPKLIGVKLYRFDGTERWLGGGGWLAGNVVAVTEAIYGNRKRYQAVFVQEPEEVWRGLRLRYSMDARRAGEALANIRELVLGLRRERGLPEEPENGRHS